MRSYRSIKLFIVALFVACGGNDGPVVTSPDANGAQQFLNFRSSRLDFEGGQPIAKLALVDVDVESKSEWCTGGCGDAAQCSPREVELLEAESSDPGILEVVAVESAPLGDLESSSSVTLRGTGAGSATLRVRALVSDGSDNPVEVEDSYVFEVVEAERFEFCASQPCSEPDDLVFLADQGIQFSWGYFGAGQALGGYGYYPIEVDPVDGAALDVDSVVYGFEVIGAASQEPVMLRSTIDDYVYPMRFIDERQIDQLTLWPRPLPRGHSGEVLLDGDYAELPSGTTFHWLVHAQHAGNRIYHAEIDLRAEIADAAFCRIYTYGVDFEDLPTQTDLLPAVRQFSLITRGAGTCTLTVTHILPDGTTGAQSTVELRLVDGEEN